jgi:hypothetical protein
MRAAYSLSLADSNWAPAIEGGAAVPPEETSPTREVRRVVLPVRIPIRACNTIAAC